MEETSNSIKRSLPAEPNSKEAFKKAKLSPAERAQKVVQEHDVGITQYVNEVNRAGGGFFGTIKQLYSDFLVNEVDLNDKVIHLEDEGIDLGKTKKERRMEQRQNDRADLQDKTPEEVSEIKEQLKTEKPKYTLSDEHREQLLSKITEEELKEIEELFGNGTNMETKTTFPDKQARGQLHQLLRVAFQGKLESATSPENTFKIMLSKNAPKSDRRRVQESINHVDENGVLNYGLGQFKKYLHFTVYKENRETMEVAHLISKFLRIPPKNINFSGTKDRRGVTCQRFSISKGKVARVSSLNKGLTNIVLGGFSYEDDYLKLGDLNGNEFTITVRDIKSFNPQDNIEDTVEKCFNSLKNNGFINYYGMQRFGTFSISTHVLGVHILNSDWKAAGELILSEQEIVTPDSVEARRIWAETSDPALALKSMPRRYTAETSILKALTNEKKGENGYSQNSYYKGIISIPRNLKLMYVHAYQSYIWNLVASKRFEMFGLEVQEGDLVIIDPEDKPKSEEAEDSDFEEDVATNNFIRAKPLTKEDVELGKYSIFDIVLPLPGFDILYPTNPQLKQVYIDSMAKDGLNPDKMGRKVRDFSLAGSYRKIMGKPKNLSYKIVNYKDDSAPLLRTDLEILRSKNEAKEKGEEATAIPRIIECSDSDADKKAVILTMQLGTSSYATMALREFMKADTARMSQNFNNTNS